MDKLYSIKSIDADVKDLDVKQGIVTGYFASFGNIDSDNDMIVPGSFTKTLKENGPQSQKQRILHLYQHDPYRPVAKPHVLKEDSRGLYFESKIADTTDGKNLLELYERGIITEHSIGFKTIKETKRDAYNEISEVKLWEGSSVTWGANENTPVTGIKSLTKESAVSKLDLFIKAFRNGTFTDDTFVQIEIAIKQIQEYIHSLLTKEPEPTTLPYQKPDDLELFKIFKSQIKV